MGSGVRWGILGTGQIAGAFAAELQLTGHHVGAVGSRSHINAESLAARFGVPKAYGSYDALVADPDIGVIYIATPHSMHAANATLAPSCGKHVLVEKPFAMNAKQAEAVVALAGKNHLVALEAMKTRFLPHMVSVRDVVASGRLAKSDPS